jgi:(2Fe-2S) ferredoxin
MSHYRCHVFACVNQRPDGHERGCCTSSGGVPLQQYMKARAKEEGLNDVRINKSYCLDRCEDGPVMVVYPEGVWYKVQSREDVDLILKQHVKGGQPVVHLRLPDARQ